MQKIKKQTKNSDNQDVLIEKGWKIVVAKTNKQTKV